MSEHGTRFKLVNDGCTCDPCRQAWNAYQTKRRHERYRYTREHGLPAGVVHNNPTYVNWGCRCTVCTQAHREAVKP